MGVDISNSQIDSLDSIGLIAGNGILPHLFVDAARNRGLKVFVIGHIGETDPDVAEKASAFQWIRFGQVGAILSFIKRHGVRELAFAGGIKRPKLLGGIRLDSVGVKIVARARSLRDDTLLREIAKEFERNGILVVAPTILLGECIPTTGRLSTRPLNQPERNDALLGWEVAKRLGELDVGQAVVVFNGVVIALEGIEGTDSMIGRAGELTAKRGGVLVKVAKPQQDLRLDLPTIGIDTITNLNSAGLSCMVIESGRSLILNPPIVVAEANRSAVSIEVWTNKVWQAGGFY